MEDVRRNKLEQIKATDHCEINQDTGIGRNVHRTLMRKQRSFGRLGRLGASRKRIDLVGRNLQGCADFTQLGFTDLA